MKAFHPAYRKYAVALAAAITEALALGLLPSPFDKYAAAVLAFLSAAGVRAVSNTPAPVKSDTGSVGLSILVTAAGVFLGLLVFALIFHNVTL